MAKINQHPGVVFKKFLDDYQLPAAKVADDIKLSQSSIRLLSSGKLKISVPIALRLAKYFGNKPEFWIDMQNKYELTEATKNDQEFAELLKNIPKAKKPAPSKKAAQKPAKGKAAAKKPARPRAKKAVPPPESESF
ncbi:MAG: HigA family addiction module antidote protein [Treponema sp.]|jgi:addiction module HigA family antidote|nr:HigA family addiction module antidote protein [Treponema sp.]